MCSGEEVWVHVSVCHLCGTLSLSVEMVMIDDYDRQLF